MRTLSVAQPVRHMLDILEEKHFHGFLSLCMVHQDHKLGLTSWSEDFNTCLL